MRSEASIDRAVVKYAKERGCLVAKLGGFRTGTNGWPDRLFIGPKGQMFFIEMKSEVGKLSVLQQDMVDALQARKVPCYVVNDAARGKAIVDAELSR